MKTNRVMAVVALCASVTVLASACSSSSGSSAASAASPAPAGSAAASDASGIPESVAANLAAGANGTFVLPEFPAVKPEAGKKVTAIVFGNQSQAGPIFTDAFTQAADAAGWTANVVDGKFSTDTYLSAVRQAIAQKVDGIVMYVIDCASFQAGAEEAKAAGIPIIYIEAWDCNEGGGTGSQTGYPLGLYNGLTTDAADYGQLMRDTGTLQADASIAANDGKMNALVLDFKETLATHTMAEAFVAESAKCSQCKTTVIDALFGDFGSALQTKVQTALLQDPTINAVFAAYDDPILNGVANGIKSANSTAYFSGEGGYPQVIDLLRNGARGMSVAYDVPMEAWASVERLNQIFHGNTEPIKVGHGVGIIDANSLPAAGQSWTSGVDFVGAYKKAWGVQ